MPSLPRPPFHRIAQVISRLPALPPSLAFAGACNRVAWAGLREMDWSAAQGRRFRILVKDLGLSLYLSVREDGLRAERAGPVDVTFTASAEDFLRLALRLEDPDTLFFNRRLLIEGDTNLGLTMKNLLDSVDWDELIRRMPLGLGHLVRLARRQAQPATA